MKAILISDHAKWCALMMNGKKNIEVRKGTALYKATKKLINEYGYADFYVYCTKDKLSLAEYLYKDGWGYNAVLNYDYAKSIGCAKEKLNGKVLFKFRCYKVEEIEHSHSHFYLCGIEIEKNEYRGLVTKYSCLNYDELHNYLKGKNGCAIHISELEIFDKPKELSEFHNAFKYKRVERKFGNNNIEKDERTGGIRQPVKGGYEYIYPLTKAPQSFCYIEVLEWKNLSLSK